MDRVRAWNRHEASTINDRLLRGRASMRERLATQGKNLQIRVNQRITNMTDDEIASLSPRELVMMAQAGMKLELEARNIGEAEMAAGTLFDTPKFEITFLQSRPAEMVGVRLADGMTGYIPRPAVEQFRVDYPDAVVII